MRFSFKEFLFPENSHLGMIAPSVIIYMVHLTITTNVSKYFKFNLSIYNNMSYQEFYNFIVGTILSLFLLISFNFKNIPKPTLIAFVVF